VGDGPERRLSNRPWTTRIVNWWRASAP
jgi:hypothetical protein